MQRERLSSPEQFRLAYREGRRFADDVLVLYARPNGIRVARVGVAVPRRIGGAVARNRLKRRIREAYWKVQHTLPAGTDLVIVPRPAAADAPAHVLERSVRALAARIRPASGTAASSAEEQWR